MTAALAVCLTVPFAATVHGQAIQAKVATGSAHGVLLKADGTVWTWGANGYGQLGNGGGGDSAEPAQAPGLAAIKDAACGGNFTVVVRDDGAVWAWGGNENGALGTDSERLSRSDVPMTVGQSVPDKCEQLFSCETGAGKYIQICGEQDEADSSKWSGIQYRFGPADGPPELIFPKGPSKEGPSLFFSHEEQKGEYRVSVRFSTGGYTYRVYSTSKGEYEGGAGVRVSDSKGKLLADISCIERPQIFIDYLRKSLPCDMKNPHGAAACRESPYRGK